MTYFSKLLKSKLFKQESTANLPMILFLKPIIKLQKSSYAKNYTAYQWSFTITYK